MPSSLASSFASAAAGNLENVSSRREGSTAGDWPRTRPNGATQTFRRPSQATTQSRDNAQSAFTGSSSGPYIPPHLNQQPNMTRNGAVGDMRYSKEQLLSIYQSQKGGGYLNRNLDDLFQGPWPISSQPYHNQTKNDNKDQNIGPEVCWYPHVDTDPFGLAEMTDAEKQLFTSSVNSTLKANHTKEGGGSTVSGRKPSVSGHHSMNYSTSATSTSRPATRRRETSESYTANGPVSPNETKSLFRTEPNTSTPPPALLRRRTDRKEDDIRTDIKDDEAGAGDGHAPFGSLRRLATGPLSTGLNASNASPWSAGGSRSAFESMGNFGSFNTTGPSAAQDMEKRPGFGSARGNSRFKDLLQKTSNEDVSSAIREKTSMSALEKLPEELPQGGQSRARDSLKNRPYRSETNPYEDDIPRTGSAALSSDGPGNEQAGFSTTNRAEGVTQATPGMRRVHDALSPTSTNPYQSPANQRTDEDETDEGHGIQSGNHPLGTGRRDMFAAAGQGGAFGSSRTPVGGLGNLPGWGGPVFGSGTPGRDRNPIPSAIGDSIFSPMSDLQSPGGSFFAAGPFGSAGRPSRLGALFPPAMQDQMNPDSRNDAFDTPTEPVSGRDPFDSGARRSEAFRSIFDDNTPRTGDGPFGSQSGISLLTGPPGSSQRTSVGPEQPSGHGPSPSGGSSSSNTLPAAQQRQMVMPDRMRWIYRDPQGNVQGPWSGLEMHDWFKAGFFTAELQVKKLEDTEYEPLAQLVRRIGNSREPFLVPQIGVPHGPPSANQGNQWANTMGAGGTQPPFANSFPSFGTTLTAEQQNALERRKQEEQYLMARQKEHLAQQQLYMKQMQMQNPSTTAHGLQHHSSAHSLQSQPSFGSITSPGGYQPSPLQAPIQPPQSMHGFSQARTSQQPLAGREDDLPGMMSQMSFSQRANVPFGQSPIGQQPSAGLPGQHAMHEAARHIGDQNAEARVHEEAFLGQDGRNERLEEFQSLREDTEDEDDNSPLPQITGAQRSYEEQHHNKQPMPIGSVIAKPVRNANEILSLTQQVQRTAAAHEKAAAQDRFIEPPPTSISPLPAPTPNRNRQHVADQLAAESRSQSQTPVEPASIAPWAQAEMPKGPSLKEIQEAEAKRAAEQEALLVASRRAQAEQERVAAAAAASIVIPAPGLPATSNWASSGSPASPSPAINAWGSKQQIKPVTGTIVSKKTLAQIQKEEEAKKQKAAAQAAAQVQANSSFSSGTGIGGKRYAELAGKGTPTTSPGANNSWIPVGSGGKPKTPATVVAAPQGTRAVSTSVVPGAAKPRPTLQTRTTSVSNKSRADEEFIRWAKSQLGNELNAGLNPDAFIRELLMLPADKEILREALYANSQTINGDRVSEEWIRRRKLADKGIIEPAADVSSPVTNDSKNAGWSEVAKKNPSKEDTTATQAFKVVSKKKGKK